MNCIPKIIHASIEMLPVAATHPNKGGNAPGIAPTNTAIDPTRFNGVYAKQYNNIETTERMVVNTFVKTSRIETLNKKQITAKIIASRTDTLFVGKGRF